MSGLHEELLGPRVTKKRIITLALVCVILVALFAYSVVIFSWFFGSPRLNPNKQLEGTEPETPILTDPPFPWDIEDLLDLFDALGLDPQDLLDLLDADFDDLDLAALAALLAGLFFSEIEVFRLYDYASVVGLSDNLWKFGCYDQFLESSWDCSYSLESHSYEPGFQPYPSNELKVSMPMSPSQTGPTSFAIPTLFPTPIIYDSVVSDPLGNINPSATQLKKNELNSATLSVDILSTNNFSITYSMLESSIKDLTDVLGSAVNAEHINQSMDDDYGQLPTDRVTYRQRNGDFELHYNALNALIDNSTDNAATIALTIQSYLQNNFNFGFNAMSADPPEDGEDIAYWFCENEEGVWSDFATTFCVFARVFGIPSRFVDGFNSRYIAEETDGTGDYIPIKYKNMYNWAEVFIPTDIDGTGEWIQVDVCGNVDPFASSGDYDLTLVSNFSSGHRNVGHVANLTAILTSSSNQSISGRPILFYDAYMDNFIGTDPVETDVNGVASAYVSIDDSQTAGLHQIVASYGKTIDNVTYSVLGSFSDPDNDLYLNLNSVNPSTVNYPGNPPTIEISGDLTDPLNSSKKGRFGVVTFQLYTKYTHLLVPGALSYGLITTGSTGEFIKEIITINMGVTPSGVYEIEASFNGIWLYGIENLVNDTDSIEINITKPEVYSLSFYINDFEAGDVTSPEIARSSTLELKAIVRDELGLPVPNKSIGFFDSNFNLLGGDDTDVNGEAIYYYTVNNSIPAGPNKLYARLGTSNVNSSYYILNDSMAFSVLNHSPMPFQIDNTPDYDGTYLFNISGYLRDSFSNPIKNADLTVHMYDGPTEVSSYLILRSAPSTLRTDDTGYFNIQHRVSSITPEGFYRIEVRFDGYFTYPGAEPDFNFIGHPNFNAAADTTSDLEVMDPSNIEILFEIDGIPAIDTYNYDDFNLPNQYNRGDSISFEVWVSQYGTGVDSGTVRFYDEDQNGAEIGSYTYTGSEIPDGYCNIVVGTGNWKAGIHLITVSWGGFNKYNLTYIIINESASIDINPLAPASESIIRDSESFSVSGTVFDIYGDLRGVEVSINLFDSFNQDVSAYIITSNRYLRTDINGEFQFNNLYIDQTLAQGEYKIRIDFKGAILHSDPFLGCSISLSEGPYMVNFESSFTFINITADTSISGFYNRTFIPDWYTGDMCNVFGTLSWDNSTGITNVYVQIIVYDSVLGILNSTVVLTDSQGDFTYSFLVTDNWNEPTTTITVYFYPNDTYSYPEAGYIEESNRELQHQT